MQAILGGINGCVYMLIDLLIQVKKMVKEAEAFMDGGGIRHVKVRRKEREGRNEVGVFHIINVENIN